MDNNCVKLFLIFDTVFGFDYIVCFTFLFNVFDMATFKNGINGSFKGRVGNVVGYEWRGKWVMRSMPKVNKNRKPTEKQEANRARFRLMHKYLSPRVDFFRKGFSLTPEVSRMSPYNAGMSYNLSNAITGEYPDFGIDYSKIVFARGDLALPRDISVRQEGEELRIFWSTEEGDASLDDQAMIMISGVEDLFGKHSGNLRSEGTESISLEDVPKATEIFVHIAFISDDRQRVSDSLYLGSVVVE